MKSEQSSDELVAGFPVGLQSMAIAYYQSQVLHAAVEREVFTRLAGRRLGLDEAAAALGLAARPARMLLEACVALELLDRDADGRFANTSIAERCLVQGRPGYFGHYVSMMVAQFYSTWGRLDEALTRNQPVRAFFEGSVETDPATARSFITAVHDSANARARALLDEPSLALALDGARRLLDVGGGSGGTAIACAERHRGLEVTLFDLPSVCEVARGFVDASPVADRIHLHPGDFTRDALPGGYDVVVIANTVQVMGPESAAALLVRAFDCLTPGGHVVVIDLLLDDDRKGPLVPALFALTMFLITNEGASYSFAEIDEWLRAAGFREAISKNLVGPYGLVVGRKPL